MDKVKDAAKELKEAQDKAKSEDDEKVGSELLNFKMRFKTNQR